MHGSKFCSECFRFKTTISGHDAGADYLDKTASPFDCQAKCQQDSFCQYWVFRYRVNDTM